MAFFTQGKASHRCYYLVLASSSIFSGSFVKFAKFYWLNPFSKIEDFLLEDLTLLLIVRKSIKTQEKIN